MAAVKCLEIIEQQKYQVKECYRLLGFLNYKINNRDISLTYYKKALSFDPDDYELLIEYASLQELSDPIESL